MELLGSTTDQSFFLQVLMRYFSFFTIYAEIEGTKWTFLSTLLY